jgi:hypothetical protein
MKPPNKGSAAVQGTVTAATTSAAATLVGWGGSCGTGRGASRDGCRCRWDGVGLVRGSLEKGSDWAWRNMHRKMASTKVRTNETQKEERNGPLK